MYDVISEAEIFIKNRLLAKASVVAVVGERVFTHPGPRYSETADRTTYPIITYDFLYPSNDTLLVGSDRFWSTLRFLVRTIDKGNSSRNGAEGAAAIYEALHGTSGYTPNGAVITSCIQIQPYKETEVMSSTQYIHLGGEYLININTPTS